MNFLIVTIPLLLLFSCSEHTPTASLHPTQEIQGRDYSGKRFNVYRARVPEQWIRRDTFPEESLADTKKPICEFLITEDGQTIRISIHNFPSETLEERIPPAAQVARWQKQFEILLPEESGSTPQSFNGYGGLKFKGIGTLNGNDTTMLAWSLQIGKDHYRSLSYPPEPDQSPLYREMRSDLTIKATGPTEFMAVHEEEIDAFARSFELIEEIPSR